MYQDKLKYDTIHFLQQYVYTCSSFTIITNENADLIVDFIEHKYIIPLTSDLEENKRIDKNLLKMAEDAVDDICDN